MKKPRWFSIVFTLSLLSALFVSHETPWPRAAASTNEIASRYGRLPLRFEANAGQVAPATRFIARGARYAVALQPQRALVQLPAANDQTVAPVLEMHWLKANPKPVITGDDELATRTHYLRGARRQQWHTDIRNYGSVLYEKVYPGIDLVWYGHQQQLEYDFRLAPHARPEQIRLAWRGADCVWMEATGDLAIAAQGHTLSQAQPLR